MVVTYFTWTIKDFDMCPQPPGQAIESPCFSIDVERATKFSLRLYPRGQEKKPTGETYVSLFLKRHCDDRGNEELKLDVSMWLLDTSNALRNRLKINESFIKSECYGGHDFIERKCLIGAERLPNFAENVLTMLCSIEHNEDGVETGIYENYEDYTDLSSNLGKLLESGNHSDMVVRVSGKEFKTHRVILEGRCPKLMRHFVKLEDSDAYSIPFVEASVFQEILQYLYTGAYCDDGNFEKVLIALNAKEFSDLRPALYHPCNISATTEINVLNVKRLWYVRQSEMNKKYTCYLCSNENPEWSRMKISLIKTENENGFGYALNFKRMCANVSIVFMQYELQCSGDRKFVLEESKHLFENECEWTTPVKLPNSKNLNVMLKVRLSACDLGSVQSGVFSENKFIREHQDFCFDFNVDKQKFQRDLRNMHRNMQNADVTLRVSSGEIPAHKAILSCWSEVFSKMFEYDTKENQTGVVDIEDIDEATMSSLVMYMYCGDIDAPLCVSSAVKLYTAADKYQVLLLKEKCCRYLKKKITVETVGDVLSLASVHHKDSLKQSCYDFITSHSEEIIKDKKCLDALKSRIHLYPDILDALLPRICKS